jgi:hypothetical protein
VKFEAASIEIAFKMAPRPPPRSSFHARKAPVTTFTWDEADNLCELFVIAGDAISEYGKKLKTMNAAERHDFTLLNLPKLLSVRDNIVAAADGVGMITHRYSELAHMMQNVFSRQFEPAHFLRFKTKVRRIGRAMQTFLARYSAVVRPA